MQVTSSSAHSLAQLRTATSFSQGIVTLSLQLSLGQTAKINTRSIQKGLPLDQCLCIYILIVCIAIVCSHTSIVEHCKSYVLYSGETLQGSIKVRNFHDLVKFTKFLLCEMLFD